MHSLVLYTDSPYSYTYFSTLPFTFPLVSNEFPSKIVKKCLDYLLRLYNYPRLRESHNKPPKRNKDGVRLLSLDFALRKPKIKKPNSLEIDKWFHDRLCSFASGHTDNNKDGGCLHGCDHLVQSRGN